MLDDTLKAQLQQYLALLRQPIRLIASLDNSETGVDMKNLLETIVGLSDKVSLDTSGDDARKPSFVVAREGQSTGVRFAGLPLGHEFTSLVLALLWTGGHPPKVEQDVIDSIKALEGNFNFEVYMSLSCHNCPDVVQALTLMALENPRITATLIEGGTFQQEVEARDIMAVPATFLNGQPFYNGKMELAEILSKLDKNADAKQAEKLAAKAPFEVLVIGGGPAGAAAAVYTARKGFSTGIAAERFGGQLMDTLGIENLPGTPYTEGPKLTDSLKKHVGEYEIDLMDLARAVELRAAKDVGGYHEVVMANGASLKARSVISIAR